MFSPTGGALVAGVSGISRGIQSECKRHLLGCCETVSSSTLGEGVTVKSCGRFHSRVCVAVRERLGWKREGSLCVDLLPGRADFVFLHD